MKTNALPYYTDYTWNDDDVSVVITYLLAYDYRPASAGVRTFANGDPGYPGDPPEVFWRVVGVVKACFVDERTLTSFEFALRDDERLALIQRFEQYAQAHDFVNEEIYEQCCREQEA